MPWGPIPQLTDWLATLFVSDGKTSQQDVNHDMSLPSLSRLGKKS